MYLNSLTIENFRNFSKEQLTFAKTNYIHGGNALGKTNILEAIYLLCNGRSFQTKLDSESIGWNSQYCRISGNTSDKTDLEVYLERTNTGRTKKVLKVGNNPRQSKIFCSFLNCVLFKPQDLEILDGSPTLRRSFLDEVIVTSNPELIGTTRQYQNVVRQRNKLLERIREGIERPDALDYWDEKLLTLGDTIESARRKFLAYANQLLPRLLSQFRLLASPKETLVKIEIKYHQKKLSKEKLLAVRGREILVGKTLHGPHRSDFQVLVDGRDLSSFGSRGQQRVVVFGLKKAHMMYLAKITEQPPLLLLDDIFSELDSNTVDSVVGLLAGQQTFITTVDIEDKNRFPDHQVSFFPL